MIQEIRNTEFGVEIIEKEIDNKGERPVNFFVTMEVQL